MSHQVLKICKPLWPAAD